MSKSKIIEEDRIIVKEESWGRIDPRDIGISSLKSWMIFSILFSRKGLPRKRLKMQGTHSRTARINLRPIPGIIGYEFEKIDEKKHLRRLIEKFLESHTGGLFLVSVREDA